MEAKSDACCPQLTTYTPVILMFRVFVHMIGYWFLFLMISPGSEN